MKIAFAIWGTLGFLFNLIGLIAVLSNGGSTNSQLLTYATCMCLFWIGGMVFFGFGFLILRHKPD